MRHLKILQYPHPILTQVAASVVDFNQTLKRQKDEMLALLYENEAFGLAANQVAIPLRFFVMDTSTNRDAPLCLVNPVMLSQEVTCLSKDEECLSLPILLSVPRFYKITVKYQNVEGESQLLSAEGLTAFCIQHEIDHLNGILSFDHLSKPKRALAIKKMQNMLSV